MIRRQMNRPSTHTPMVYTLPRDHDLAQQVMLEPCKDLTFLLDEFRRDVSALTGVPHEMIIGRDHCNHETVRKTIASGRIFFTNMHELCRHFQYLLAEVYSSIYKSKKGNVEFVLTPMPRLEVETIGDFKVLFEIGALTPDMSLELSKLLLGSAARRGKQNDKRDNSEAGQQGGSKQHMNHLNNLQPSRRVKVSKISVKDIESAYSCMEALIDNKLLKNNSDCMQVYQSMRNLGGILKSEEARSRNHSR